MPDPRVIGLVRSLRSAKDALAALYPTASLMFDSEEARDEHDALVLDAKRELHRAERAVERYRMSGCFGDSNE